MTDALRLPYVAVPKAIQPVISMVDVGMTYPNGKVALVDVNVSIPEGDFVFLVGPSGAGKSTFIRLLIREQLPTAGRVVVAGRDLSTMRRSQVPSLRRRIGIVFQDFRLLPAKTVYENVAFALEVTGATSGEIRRRVPRLLNLVGLHEHDDHLPAQLSGGEQQRTAIARALVRDPLFLLLDDALSAVDTQTEERILRALREIRQGRTVLIDSHRVSSVKDADPNIVLDDGRIVERGTHEALVVRDGYYAELYRKQTLEEEIAEIA
jgi:cell division transport system ATP-binding protein